MNLAFFLPDADRTRITPGYENVLFLNIERTPQGRHPVREYIAFRRLVPDLPERGSWMAEGVVIVGLSSQGKVYEVTAPFGKILPNPGGPERREEDRFQGRLILRGLDPQSEMETFYTPSLILGEPPELLEGVLPFTLTTIQLRGLARESRGYRSQDLFTLWQNRTILPSLGVSPTALDREILSRLVYPFTFFIAALLAVALGWRHRQRGGRPAVATVLLVPALPFLLSLFEKIYMAMESSIMGFCLISLGFGATLVLTLVLQGILFTLAFLFLASQHSL